MVCAMLPLFTMRGPEGQLFRPMAETYAFAIGGALILACTTAPVLCLLLFKNLKAHPDNFLVRYLKRSYLQHLEFCLNHRLLIVGVFGTLILGTLATLPFLGREFMPALEEGHLWIRGIYPGERLAAREFGKIAARPGDHVRVSRSGIGRVASSAGPIRASIPPASTARNSSCRSSRSKIGRRPSPTTRAAARCSAPSGRVPSPS